MLGVTELVGSWTDLDLSRGVLKSDLNHVLKSVPNCAYICRARRHTNMLNPLDKARSALSGRVTKI